MKTNWIMVCISAGTTIVMGLLFLYDDDLDPTTLLGVMLLGTSMMVIASSRKDP